MSKGTKAGFFAEKKPAAVLKHQLLGAYLKPFTTKIGKWATGGRVVYVDGYAGQGFYGDGSTTSPELALNTARGFLGGDRQLECLFVEKDAKNYASLRTLVDTYKAQGVACEAFHGELAQHMPSLIKRAAGAPLFLFMDPCGLGLPYETLVDVLNNQRPDKPGTEVLLNFSAEAVRRIGGHLVSDNGSPEVIATLDRSCGGTWWQDLFLSAGSSPVAVERVARGFVERISRDAKGQGWAAAVRNRADIQPVYHLVFFTRHLHGAWLFGDSLASAQKAWRRTLSPPPNPDDGGLFPLPDPFPAEEADREAANIATIKDNLLATRQKHGPFLIGPRWREVYSDVYGLANESQVRKAVKELHREGLTAATGIGGKTIRDHHFLA